MRNFHQRYTRCVNASLVVFLFFFSFFSLSELFPLSFIPFIYPLFVLRCIVSQLTYHGRSFLANSASDTLAKIYARLSRFFSGETETKRDHGKKRKKKKDDTEKNARPVDIRRDKYSNKNSHTWRRSELSERVNLLPYNIQSHSHRKLWSKRGLIYLDIFHLSRCSSSYIANSGARNH